MTDLEAIRLAPSPFILSALFSLGITLMFGASWRFGIGLWIVLGMIVWFTTVSHVAYEQRKSRTVTDSDFKEQG